MMLTIVTVIRRIYFYFFVENCGRVEPKVLLLKLLIIPKAVSVTLWGHNINLSSLGANIITGKLGTFITREEVSTSTLWWRDKLFFESLDYFLWWIGLDPTVSHHSKVKQ